MKNKSPRKPSTSKRATAKPAKRTTPSPAAKPAKAAPKPTAKGAPSDAPKPAKASRAKGRTAVHHAPENAPKPAPEAAPHQRSATLEPHAPAFEVREEREIPGDAIDGYRFARAIRYAAKVTPKEDGVLVFTHAHGPLPLVAGHDQRRAHVAYLGAKSAFHLDAAVPRDEALSFAALLEGLAHPLVRLAHDGIALVRHGTAQPPVRFDLGHRPITQHWQPPTSEGRAPAVGPLRISASWQGAACRWSKAVSHTFQSADGIAWINLSDEETGEPLARAVLAEDGKDLYPEDNRQTEIPGSRTAGDRASTPPKAPKPAAAPSVPAPVEEPAEEATATSGGSVTIEADGQEVAVDEDVAAPAFPTPGARPVVVEIPADLFDALSDAQQDALRVPGATEVFWFVGDEVVTSASMDAASATATAGLLSAAGLSCAKADPTKRHGIEVDLWAVERAPATKAEG